VIRATEGPLAAVRGVRPDDLEFEGSAEPMGEVWIAVRAALRSVLEQVSVADVARGKLPKVVGQLASRRGARDPH
jgi:DNA-binding IscR family transcriptional regulator